VERRCWGEVNQDEGLGSGGSSRGVGEMKTNR